MRRLFICISFKSGQVYFQLFFCRNFTEGFIRWQVLSIIYIADRDINYIHNLSFANCKSE